MDRPLRSDQPHDTAEGFARRPSLRALVVDDNRDTADSLAVLLRLAGHQVWTVYDGPAAIVTACACRPEVVFLDLLLPGLDGFEVAAWLRKQEALRDAVLVAVTGFGDAQSRDRATEAGFDHFFVKPVDFAELDRLMAAAGQKAAAGSGT